MKLWPRFPPTGEILFCPDQFLGAHVQRSWRGQHAHLDGSATCSGYQRAELRRRVMEEPDAELFIHPECGCATSALYLVESGEVPKDRTHILSTGGMGDAALKTKAKKVLIATETGIIHQLKKSNPLVIFEPVNRAAVCKYMKMITPEKLLPCLKTGRDEVTFGRHC